MGFTYTLDQEKVINTKGCNVLVSAAAGSGKTAVLVERIIKTITNKENLISIDQLLIVTFTHAAASEMRERIGNGIEKAIEEARDDEVMNHLIKQLTLLAAANIMTLHSFCLKVIKNYYPTIDLDPGFRIGNETELVLIKEEVIEDLLEEEYKEARPSFINVVESFASGKNDNPIKDLIFQIYRFAMSNPWPEQWLNECVNKLEINSLKEYLSSDYFMILKSEVLGSFSIIQEQFGQLDDLMVLEGGPDKYMDTVTSLYELYQDLDKALNEEDYIKLKSLYENRSIPPLSRKTKGYDKELAEEGKNMINSIKKNFEAVELLLFDEKTLMEEIHVIKGCVFELVRLSLKFKAMYSLGKEDKNLIDFNDIEHFALKLLYVDGEVSPIAKSLRDSFVEVLVDEYQDTNEVQEAILLSVSKQNQEGNNLFMVGDLKQSIYKFRLAKPEIFRDKYESFSYENSNNIKIDLAKNFRSRREVVAFANLIFDKVMSKEIGDVAYDDKTKLYYGAMNYEEVEDLRYQSELLLIEQGQSSETKAKIEARAISAKIKSLVLDKEFQIYDKGIDGLRDIKYQDICILMRSPASTIEDIKETFAQEDIPYVSDVSSGYFDAVEVQIVLNLLRIIDNPYQDIPLVSVLRSPLFELKENELLEIRGFLETGSFYEALLAFSGEQVLVESLSEEKSMSENGLLSKIQKFLDYLKELKDLALIKPLDEVIDRIYHETGFTYFVQFMENGEQRLTNLNYLKTQAFQFEQSSYKGLFNFIRYIEHIKKYEIEIPEPLSSHQVSGVTLMSIHKSKGLEFPIVFLIDIHKQFNLMDLRKSFVIHQNLGFGCDYFDPSLRLRKESGFSKAIKIKGKKELLSEELRLLYVALTRPKEKLYLVGLINDYEEKVKPIQEAFMTYLNQVPPAMVEKAKSYLELILMACPPSGKEFKISLIEAMDEYEDNPDSLDLYHEYKYEKIDLLQKPQTEEEMIKAYDYYKKVFEPYPYEEQSGKYITLSVSELKALQNKLKLSEDHYEIQESFIKHYEKNLPEFISKKDKTLQGAQYGLIMHKVLSLLPLKDNYDYNEIKTFVDALIKSHILEKEYENKIYIKPILAFTQSSIYQRILQADREKKCYREQPFVLGIHEEEDIRMIQGVIDLYFEEAGHLILLDYKTDYIEEGQEDILVDRYKVQLDYYQSALEEITQLKVKERFIYSLSLSRLISL